MRTSVVTNKQFRKAKKKKKGVRVVAEEKGHVTAAEKVNKSAAEKKRGTFAQKWPKFVDMH